MLEFSSNSELPTLYLGIGIPGSGKTTYLKQLEKELNIARIDADVIREWLT